MCWVGGVRRAGRDAWRPMLAKWCRWRAGERIHLDPMTLDELWSVVRALHRAPMSEPDLRTIITRAECNAFCAEELVAATEQCADTRALPWQLADLLLVRENPVADLRILQDRKNIQVIMQNGRFHKGEPSAAHGAAT